MPRKNRLRRLLKEYGRILASQKEREIFFNALANPPEPNAHLKNAVSELNSLLNS
jgi:uncharacterized protein (DUF1778 family)